jgi:hypothetical protein
MQQVAKKRGGRCLSNEYISALYPLKWQCKKGHTWNSSALIMSKGLFWCVQCRKDDALENAKQIAISRGGKCLSDEYVRINTNMQWVCAKGHIWQARLNNVRDNKTWCPVCIKVTIEDMQELALEKGGVCLSKKYRHSHTKLQWKCKEGHIWKAVPSAIKQGEWCGLCAVKRNGEKQRDTIENMQRIAKKRGGKCLSKQYVNGTVKLKWSCREGHIWETNPDNIRRGTWCPKCAHLKAIPILDRGRQIRMAKYKTT